MMSFPFSENPRPEPPQESPPAGEIPSIGEATPPSLRPSSPWPPLGDLQDEDSEEEPVSEDEEPEEESTAHQEEESLEISTEWFEEQFQGLREDLAVGQTEARRSARRVMEVLKEFGSGLDALSGTLQSIQSLARQPVTAAPASATGSSSDLLPGLMELADRLDRIAGAASRRVVARAEARAPVKRRPWFVFSPPSSAPVADPSHDEEDRRLSDSLEILRTHVKSLLEIAGLEAIAPAHGELFDPQAMSAIEVERDARHPDHTVLACLLPGWRDSSTGRLLRPAQVRVSRLP